MASLVKYRTVQPSGDTNNMAPLNPNANAFVPSTACAYEFQSRSPPADMALTNEEIEEMDKWVQERWNWVSMLEEDDSEFLSGSSLPSDLYE